MIYLLKNCLGSEVFTLDFVTIFLQQQKKNLMNFFLKKESENFCPNPMV
jgi:hypothetical protein